MRNTKVVWTISLPILLGILSVLQGTFNRKILESWDIVSMLVFNSVVVMIFSALLLLIRYLLSPGESSFFAPNFDTETIRFWYLIPPLTIVLISPGLAFSIYKMDASTVFVFFIVGQVFMSLVWDGMVKDTGFPTFRLVGAMLVLTGGVLVSLNNGSR